MHDTEQRPKGPTRTCAGCQKRGDASEVLVRVVLGSPASSGASGATSGEKTGARPVVVDMASSAFGRGAHVHPDVSCLKKACASGFARAFKCAILADVETLQREIVQGCDRRLEGLLVGARRGKKVAIGEEAGSAMAAGAPLAVLASDAGANVLKQFAWGIEDGRAVAWKDKAGLGSLLARDEVAAVVVKDAGIAREFMRVRAIASSVVAKAAK
jgi:hypothetical protein